MRLPGPRRLKRFSIRATKRGLPTSHVSGRVTVGSASSSSQCLTPSQRAWQLGPIAHCPLARRVDPRRSASALRHDLPQRGDGDRAVGGSWVEGALGSPQGRKDVQAEEQRHRVENAQEAGNGQGNQHQRQQSRRESIRARLCLSYPPDD